MRAMRLERLDPAGTSPAPLRLSEAPKPEPGSGELLLRVLVCGVCHTELDEIAGRTAPPRLPVIPGHQVVGVVEAAGPGASAARGTRVGVSWIGGACGTCEWCGAGFENLCPQFVATGRDRDGGYAEFMTARQDFAIPIPEAIDDAAAAPLLCAGAVGYRSLRLTGLRDGEPLGLTGFGASAHIVLQLARHLYPQSSVFVFARNAEERAFAASLGATWTGDTGDRPPEALQAIIDTTPAWRPVLAALRSLRPGGRLVINAIRKEDRDREELRELSYAEQLWMEREIKSVANVTREDVGGMLLVAAQMGLKPEVEEVPLEMANDALTVIRDRRIRGAKVLRVAPA
jgi:propanol-preferring alcohol dehydrogenase